MSGSQKLVLCIIALINAPSAYAARPENPEIITSNQMRTAAGTLANGVLTVRIDARNGVWYPDGPGKFERQVAAFAEEGKGLQNPGPLVRVTAGTEVRMTFRNSLDKPLWLFGLGQTRGIQADSFVVAPGATREISFKAGEPGIYYYAGKTSKETVLGRFLDDSQLNGAIVIDASGVQPPDRIFLISWYGDLDSTSVSGLSSDGVIVINGLSWPHTERIRAVQGEEQHWRWLTVTAAPHPMHLHGFYFRLNGTGDGATFTELPPEERPLAVTQLIAPGGSMSITWTPNRPGNWIFHCHFAGHMTSIEGLNKDRRYPEGEQAAHAAKPSHDGHFMADLIVGIIVEPKGEQKASTRDPRPLRLIIRSKPKVYGEYAGYAYVLGGSQEESDPNAMPVPGPTLFLEKDQPVAITIVNHSHDPAAVHWHGIELESFPDGVPGVSGYGTNVLPSIPARDSLTIHFTPPRVGTFMYHSHSNEMQQIGSGLYGTIIVHEPGQKPDPETDRILMLTDAGPTVNVIKDRPGTYLNGTENPEPMELKVGTTYRFRVINIRAEWGGYIKLTDGEQPVMWRAVARDGADLPATQRKMMPAELMFGPGQIFDYELTPQKAGELKLMFGYPQLPGRNNPPLKDMVMRVK
jgi:FtsP/CotA-like multicopper oxidase with cupredoxin domain